MNGEGGRCSPQLVITLILIPEQGFETRDFSEGRFFLRSLALFRRPRLFFLHQGFKASIVSSGDIDIAPETLYDRSVRGLKSNGTKTYAKAIRPALMAVSAA